MVKLKYTVDIKLGENSEEVKILENYGFHRRWDRATGRFEGLEYDDRGLLFVTISNYDEIRERAQLSIELYTTNSIDQVIWLTLILLEAGVVIWDPGVTALDLEGELKR